MAQLVTLQLRLLRDARAFLDPELQSGKVTQEQAYKVLEKDVVISHAFATEEVERFTYRSPGQADSYFYGYTKLLQLRKDTEAALGEEIQPEEVSRLPAGAGAAATRPDAQGGDGEVCAARRRSDGELRDPTSQRCEMWSTRRQGSVGWCGWWTARARWRRRWGRARMVIQPWWGSPGAVDGFGAERLGLFGVGLDVLYADVGEPHGGRAFEVIMPPPGPEAGLKVL